MAVIEATGAGVRHRRRWLVRDLDLRVEPGETIAITGPPGSGRTSTLLALAGRLRLTTGTVTHTGTAALGHVPGVDDPEPVFTVLEHVRERLTLLGRPRRLAAEVPMPGLDPGLRGRDLSPYRRHLLGLVLAGLSRPAVIALDGVDAGLNRTERDDLWERLDEITADGVAVLVTAREIDPARVDRVVLLSDPHGGDAGRATVLTPDEYAATFAGSPAGGAATATPADADGAAAASHEPDTAQEKPDTAQEKPDTAHEERAAQLKVPPGEAVAADEGDAATVGETAAEDDAPPQAGVQVEGEQSQ